VAEMDGMKYRVPVGAFEHEYLVKKSRFIARVLPVDSRQQVNAAVQQARHDYPDARHHCWAYLLGKPADAISAGMSDDGEPAGTAGKPILNVLQHGDLGNVLVIVVSYFGGVKLGAGGLVRAYGTATRLARDQAPAEDRRELLQYWASGDFSVEQPLRHFIAGIEGQALSVDYTESVRVTLAVPAEQADALAAFCAAHAIELEADD
jgi:uncharacterized YigZ family protein